MCASFRGRVWLLLFAAASLPGGQAAAETLRPLRSEHSEWQLIAALSDEFDGTDLDTAKWNNDVEDWGVWSWEPENASVSGGHLNLRMEYNEHRRARWTLHYKSGIVKSRSAPVRYGYFEVRMKAAPRYPGVSPAFWAYKQEAEQWTELDFVELTQRRRDPKIVDTNVHVFRAPSFPGALPLQEERSWMAPWDPRDDFHVYGCEWGEKEIRWYVDGQQIQFRPNDYWHQPLDIVVSFGVRGDLKKSASPEGFPTVFQVDYVRVWSAVN